MHLFSLKKLVSPFWRLVLFLVLIPILELFLMLNFLGGMLTLLSMFVSGLFGVCVAYREGLFCLRQLREDLDRGEPPTLPALHGVLILSAAFLMILPGLLTSLLGVFLLFPLTRSFVVSYIVLRFEAQRRRAGQRTSPHSPEIIDIV